MKVQVREVQFGVDGAFWWVLARLRVMAGFSLVGALLFGRAVDDASSLFDGDVKINNVVLLIWVRKRTIGNGT